MVGESSGPTHATAEVVSHEGMGNEAFEGLSDLAIDMDLKREVVEPAVASAAEVRALLLKGESAWMAETNEVVACRLVSERREQLEVRYQLWADFMDEMAGLPTDFNFAEYLQAHPYDPSSRPRRLIRIAFPSPWE